ncbi:MAG: glucose-6-phosphate isomerase [Ruminococcaceae bacterium]|nr:glucose-6-phosphate isomerase [Oscillospiraceae bacterium]
MALKLNNKFIEKFVSNEDIANISAEIYEAQKLLASRTGEGNDFLGWVDLPVDYDKEEFERIKKAAKKIQSSCDVFIVIGIGGSYLGARAAIEFVKSPVYNNIPNKDTPDIYFAGNSISASALNDLLKICEGKDVCVNVVSKSGTTTEPAVAFRVFRALLEEKYGKDGAKERIFATTDKAKGTLKKFSDENSYETFVVPDDVGGRFSVLTAVGLLPIAVAGIDIDLMMKGAQDARIAYSGSDINTNDCLKYVAIRNILYRQGKSVEILAAYEPAAQMLCEWWKQLYGESEGKDGKGIYPSSVIFSTDLHSLGQFIQDGSRIMFETVLDIKKANDELLIPFDPNNVDKLNFLSGKDLDYVNHTAMLGTLFAHSDGNVPNIVLELNDRSEYSFGYLIYFFELACAVSGYTLGVNPFNQPGVESYKKNMFALLGKEGYEELREELNKRIK